MSRIPFASGPFKVCSNCGREISQAQWEALPLIGYQVIPPYPPENDPGEVLEMRNDHCHSTITILMPFTAEELEEVVEQVQLSEGLPLKLARSKAVAWLKKERR